MTMLLLNIAASEGMPSQITNVLTGEADHRI